MSILVMLMGAIGGALALYDAYRTWQCQIADAKRRHRDELVARACEDYRRDAA